MDVMDYLDRNGRQGKEAARPRRFFRGRPKSITVHTVHKVHRHVVQAPASVGALISS